MIHHRPNLDVEAVEKHYSEKDGVPIKYVCTSALDTGTISADIYFRETPHPEFGNRYFGLYKRYGLEDLSATLMICGADQIEDLEFEMVQDRNGKWHYSQDRHDFYDIGGLYIDGGRAYLKLLGDDFKGWARKTMRVKDGRFVEDE